MLLVTAATMLMAGGVEYALHFDDTLARYQSVALQQPLEAEVKPPMAEKR